MHNWLLLGPSTIKDLGILLKIKYLLGKEELFLLWLVSQPKEDHMTEALESAKWKEIAFYLMG